MRKLSFGTSHTFEFGMWQLILRNITVNVVGIYRSPTVSTPAQFVPDFFEFMEDTLSRHTNILIMGDFNLHTNENNATISEF
jgi:exonuclease III